MKKMIKLLLGCLIILVLFCLLSGCLCYFFWDKIHNFISSFFGNYDVHTSNVKLLLSYFFKV